MLAFTTLVTFIPVDTGNSGNIGFEPPKAPRARARRRSHRNPVIIRLTCTENYGLLTVLHCCRTILEGPRRASSEQNPELLESNGTGHSFFTWYSVIETLAFRRAATEVGSALDTRPLPLTESLSVFTSTSTEVHSLGSGKTGVEIPLYGRSSRNTGDLGARFEGS